MEFVKQPDEDPGASDRRLSRDLKRTAVVVLVGIAVGFVALGARKFLPGSWSGFQGGMLLILVFIGLSIWFWVKRGEKMSKTKRVLFVAGVVFVLLFLTALSIVSSLFDRVPPQLTGP